ncbi:MAG: hypothetical protein GXP62_18625 [Oligoflexia bacterium]|nr:hypothetical protein [Oligoflexia bacterium]
MRTLIPTLAIMLGFALACGEGDNNTDQGPVITVQPQTPTPPPVVPQKPAEPTTKVVTQTISTTVAVTQTKKGTIEKEGRQAIIAKGKAMGYSRVTNIKLGATTCKSSRCTATATGSVSKTVTVEPEDNAGSDGDE